MWFGTSSRASLHQKQIVKPAATGDFVFCGDILSCVFLLGPNWYEIFRADADTDIWEQENSNIQYMDGYSTYIIY